MLSLFYHIYRQKASGFADLSGAAKKEKRHYAAFLFCVT
jgi:hypothetical protein